MAQKLKGGVAVFGTGPGAYAAAIQSAHSGVKTILIDEKNFTSLNLTAADTIYRKGVYANFLKRADSLKKKPEFAGKTILSPEFAAKVFKSWADTVKNLTLLSGAIVKEIKRDGKNWEIEFKDKRFLKANVIVDVSGTGVIQKLAGVKSTSAAPVAAGAYVNKLYRTGVVALPESNILPNTLPLSALTDANTENFISLGKGNVPSTILAGQAAGAAAAYCSFFNTTTKSLNVRLIQAELLSYKSQLVKFTDIALADSNSLSIQRIAVTGILKGKMSGADFLFMPDSTVTINDIKAPVREYYSRSQIWFLDKKTENLTVGDAIGLIKFTANRGDELNKEIEKSWNASLRLKGKFELKRLITRREFAVLVDTYMKPFDRTVDMTGNLKS